MTALADAFLLDHAQYVECGRFGRADTSGAAAMRAHLGARFEQARAQALARQLEQAEGADVAHLDPRAVVLHRLLEAALDRAVVLGILHVDEVDDDEPGEVAQPELAGDLLGRLQIGLVRGLLDVALARGAARVDVDGDQRLGRVEDDVATRFEAHHRAVHGVELAFHLIAVIQRDALVILNHALGVARHEPAHEVLGHAVAVFALDQHLFDVLGVEVADRAVDEVGFLVDERRRDRLQRQLANVVPQVHQVLEVALDLGLGAAETGGAQDDADTLGHRQLGGDRLEALAIVGVDDLARNAAAARGVGHEHAIAPGEREIRGERRALVAALFLDDLDEHDLAPLDHLLDLVAA